MFLPLALAGLALAGSAFAKPDNTEKPNIKAGYAAEYVGKLLNGYNVWNAHIRPKGWDWVDALLDPYTTYYNTPVMSQNGETPVYYHGWHSTDVVRIKALDRLDRLTDGDAPAGKALFYDEDTNLPPAGGARAGRAAPQGAKSRVPSVHPDLAPTFLDIAGLAPGGLASLPRRREPAAAVENPATPRQLRRDPRQPPDRRRRRVPRRPPGSATARSSRSTLTRARNLMAREMNATYAAGI
ncbi:hypothetical protein F4780DRAFT_783484 [Xylariomycetidae sp. FL0641]|nr:hypothetical protein F4780DRAFT_783484 [Xylariomycetidae sp. FL0641]